MNLTNLEIAAMELTLNYSDREGQLGDNFSNAGAEEIAYELFNGNKQAAGGLIASLIKKNAAFLMDDCDDQVWLTEDGVNALFDIIEAR